MNDPRSSINPRQALDFIFWLFMIALLIVAAQALYLGNLPNIIRQMAIMLAISGAALMFGALVGFLFGIPRRLQREVPAQPMPGATAIQRPIYEGNTNLEQISDWLTKLIVGVTLVEFTNIVNTLRDLGGNIERTTGNSGDSAFSVGVIIFFFVTGFLFGYLWTRLYLGRALTDAELSEKIEFIEQKAEEVSSKMDEFRQQAQANVEAIAFARRQLDPTSAPASDLAEAESLLKKASPDALVQVFYHAKENRSSNWKANKPQMERSMIIFQALTNIDVEKHYHRHVAQLAYCYKDKLPPDYRKSLELLNAAIEIRGDVTDKGWHDYEANRAIVLIQLAREENNSFALSTEQNDAIIKDMKVALEEHWVRSWIIKDPLVQSWAAENKYNLPSK